MVAALPVALLVHRAHTEPSRGRLSPDAAARAEETRNTLLAFFACVFALLAFTVKLKASSIPAYDSLSYAPPRLVRARLRAPRPNRQAQGKSKRHARNKRCDIIVAVAVKSGSLRPRRWR
eukprot:9470877-Pyramimonas_sp.AAC.1